MQLVEKREGREDSVSIYYVWRGAIKSPWSPAVIYRTIKTKSSIFGVRGVWICWVCVLLMFQQSSSLFIWIKFQTKDVAERRSWNYVNEPRRPCRVAHVCDCKQATKQHESVCPSNAPGGGRMGGTPSNGLYGEAPPERSTFFRLQVYKRVGISQTEFYKRVGKSAI